ALRASSLAPQPERGNALDLRCGKAPVGKRGTAAFAALGRRAAHAAGRARVARRSVRLLDVRDRDIARARNVVRVALRFGERQHRREARIRAFERRAPFGTRLRLEDLREARAQLRAAVAVVLPL